MRYLALFVLLLMAGAGCRDKSTTPQVDNSLPARFPVPENSARKDGFSKAAIAIGNCEEMGLHAVVDA